MQDYNRLLKRLRIAAEAHKRKHGRYACEYKNFRYGDWLNSPERIINLAEWLYK